MKGFHAHKIFRQKKLRCSLLMMALFLTIVISLNVENNIGTSQSREAEVIPPTKLSRSQSQHDASAREQIKGGSSTLTKQSGSWSLSMAINGSFETVRTVIDDEKTIYLIGAGNDVISVYRSTNYGNSWSFFKSLTVVGLVEQGIDAAVDLFTDKVYVVYEHEPNAGGHHDISLWHVMDDITTSVEGDTTIDARNPSIAIEFLFKSIFNFNYYFYVAHEKIVPNVGTAVVVTVSQDQGVTWSEWHVRNPINQSDVFGDKIVSHYDPDVAVDANGNVFLTYLRHESDTLSGITGSIVVEHGPSSSTNAEFENVIFVDNGSLLNLDMPSHPSIAASRNSGTPKIVVAYSVGSSLSSYSIRASYSTDGGASFSIVFIDSLGTNATSPEVTVTGMDTRSVTTGDFYITYPKSDGSVEVMVASPNDLSSWSRFVSAGASSLYDPPMERRRAVGITTMQNGTQDQFFAIMSFVDVQGGELYYLGWIPSLPPIPLLSTPENETALNSSTISLTWFALSLFNPPASFDLQLDDSPLFTTPSVNENVADIEYNVTLADGTYYWRVRSVTVEGFRGTWSAIGTFTIDTVPPDNTTLLLPSDGETLNVSMPTLSWNEIPEAIEYHVQVASSTTFSNLNADAIVNVTTFTLNVSLMDGTFYWRVKARDAAGNAGNWSSTWSFTVDTTGPNAPTLTAPVNGSVLSNGTPILSWEADPDVTTYQLQIDDDDQFSSPETDILLSDSNYQVLSTTSGVMYHWRVRGVDAVGNWGEWSNTWTFQVTELTTTTTAHDSPPETTSVYANGSTRPPSNTSEPTSPLDFLSPSFSAYIMGFGLMIVALIRLRKQKK